MSTVRTTVQVAGVIAAAVAVGTAYVLVHEHRRKGKKDKKKVTAAGAGSSSEDRGLSAERLIEVLGESANAAYQLIEQVRAAPEASALSISPPRRAAGAQRALGTSPSATWPLRAPVEPP